MHTNNVKIIYKEGQTFSNSYINYGGPTGDWIKVLDTSPEGQTLLSQFPKQY